MSFFSRVAEWARPRPPALPTSAPPADDTRAKLRAQLRRDEGCVLRAYRDSLGVLTIGVGHNLDADPVLRDRLVALAGGDEHAVVIDLATAERLLDNDIAMAEDDVRQHIPVASSLDACRRAVLVNMRFNVGLGVPGKTGLLGFSRMLAAVERGQYATAAAEMMDSRWSRQVGARASRLAEQMRDGTWAT